jgi:hypothetical protein
LSQLNNGKKKGNSKMEGFIRLTKEGSYGQFYYIYLNIKSIDSVEPNRTADANVKSSVKVRRDVHNVYETVDEIMEEIMGCDGD